MKHVHPILIVLTSILATACASQPQQVETVTPEVAPGAKGAPAKESARKAPVSKEAAIESEGVGRPAVSSSKFAKLKIGMTLNQVKKLIGPPTRQWTHPTDKVHIPFYFGPDRWVIQYSYKSEGVLTLNSGGEQLLTSIEVNKAE